MLQRAMELRADDVMIGIKVQVRQQIYFDGVEGVNCGLNLCDVI